MNAVIYRYNGKQVHIYSYLEKYWETDTRIQLFRETLGNRYTFTVIYRYDGKQLHVCSYLEKYWETGTHILIYTYYGKHVYVCSNLQMQ